MFALKDLRDKGELIQLPVNPAAVNRLDEFVGRRDKAKVSGEIVH